MGHFLKIKKYLHFTEIAWFDNRLDTCLCRGICDQNKKKSKKKLFDCSLCESDKVSLCVRLATKGTIMSRDDGAFLNTFCNRCRYFSCREGTVQPNNQNHQIVFPEKIKTNIRALSVSFFPCIHVR